MNTTTLRAFTALASVVVFALGCESASESGTTLNAPAKATTTQTATVTTASAASGTSASAASGTSAAQGTTSTASSSSASSTQNTPAAQQTSGTTTQATTPVSAPVAGDQIGYGSLRWSYGGISGGGYSPSGVSISGLRMGGNSLSFKYGTNLSAWGYANGDARGYACLFVQKADGSWVGGKFDWISSSRSSRDLKNVLGGYAGWNLSDVPNPCSVAFVILDSGSRRRSNVIVGSWKR